MEIFNYIKKIFIHIRTSMKLFVLLCAGTILIGLAVTFIYRPIYSVTLQGEHIGYIENKSKLQNKINEYMKNGEGEQIAFVQIDELPQYKLCLLKKQNLANEEEIFEKVKSLGTVYYKYYAVLEDGTEKLYVSSAEQAEEIINKLKEKNSTNKAKLAYIEKYETELTEFTDVETAVSKLYIKPVVTVASYGYANTSLNLNMSQTKLNLGISLIRPVSGTITSRFGVRSSIRSSAHTGLDIAAPSGTPIKAVADGTVTFAGTKGSYGKLIIITHSNGVQTYYAHCSSLVASYGQKVSQGQVIAKVGTTGNSTGNHLHLEIRVNGVAQNPQNYLY